MRAAVFVRSYEGVSVGACESCQRRGNAGVVFGGTLPGRRGMYFCRNCARELRDGLAVTLGEDSPPRDRAASTLSAAVEDLRGRVEVLERARSEGR